jgi:protein subunit release factor B
MPDSRSQGQADKAAAEQAAARVGQEEQQREEAKSAAAKSLQADPAEVVNPYPNYDLMTLDQLRDLAKERNVEINRDVEKAHLVTELRAADTHTG